MRYLFALLLVLSVAACSPKEKAPQQAIEPEPKTMAAMKAESMESQISSGNFPLLLDRSTILEVTEYMGREPDSMRRAPAGDLRYLGYAFADGSELIFAMKAAASGGLVLSHFEADPID